MTETIVPNIIIVKITRSVWTTDSSASDVFVQTEQLARNAKVNFVVLVTDRLLIIYTPKEHHLILTLVLTWVSMRIYHRLR